MAAPTAAERAKLIFEICAYEMKGLSEGSLMCLAYAMEQQIIEAEKEAVKPYLQPKKQDDLQTNLFPDRKRRH